MSFNFREYVRELLMEQTAIAGANVSSIAGSNYKEDPPASGIFVSTTGKDPYSYSVISSNDKQSVIKIMSAPKGRQSAVNKTFKITTGNLDNPNVQLLYASLLNLGKLTRLSGDTGNFKISNLTAEIMIVGQGFGYESFFEEQHNKIKRLGHENADSTLVYQRAGLGVINPQGSTLTDQLQNMISKIETKADLQVVALLIFPGSVRYMAKENSLKYVHDVFEVPRDSDFVSRVNEMIQAPPADTSGESMEITVDPSAEPARETMQAIPGESGPGVNPGEQVDRHDRRTSKFVETREGINVELSDGKKEAMISLPPLKLVPAQFKGSLCVEIPGKGRACYKSSLGDIVGLKHVNDRVITLTVKPIIGKGEEKPVTLAKVKNLIDNLKSGGRQLPEEIEIEGYTFKKVRQ